MIFESAFKAGNTPVLLLCSPSTWSDFDPGHWWRDKEEIQSTLSEIVKIGDFLVFERRMLKNKEN